MLVTENLDCLNPAILCFLICDAN